MSNDVDHVAGGDPGRGDTTLCQCREEFAVPCHPPGAGMACIVRCDWKVTSQLRGVVHLCDGCARRAGSHGDLIDPSDYLGWSGLPPDPFDEPRVL